MFINVFIRFFILFNVLIYFSCNTTPPIPYVYYWHKSPINIFTCTKRGKIK
nr:MAG TPA: hypothetical protein [Caudoviricetes sp.]